MVFKISYKAFCALLPLLMACSMLNSQTNSRATEKQKALESCKKREFTSSQYDCECLIAKYDETAEQIRTGNTSAGGSGSDADISPALLKKYTSHLERHCKAGRNIHIKKVTSGKMTYLKITPVMMDDSPFSHRPACEILERAKNGQGLQTMAVAQNEPDFMAVMSILYKTTDCLPNDKLYDTYYKDAQANLSLLVLGNLLKVSKEDYCTCYAAGMTKAVKEGLTVGGPHYENMRKALADRCSKGQ